MEPTIRSADGFVIRMAGVEDIPLIALHRAMMFRDMGRLQPEAFDQMAANTHTCLEEAMPAGTYKHWLVAPEDDRENIVAGGGLQLRQVLPWVDADNLPQAAKQALILNVYCLPAYRRKGLALLVMETLHSYCQQQGIRNIVLHASEAGRALYEKLGYKLTHEMRYPFTTKSPTDGQ